MNRVTLEGFLGADPIIRAAQSGTLVANLSVATHERRGEEQYTEWHRVVLFGKLAEAAQRYYRKGKQVLIEGRLQTRQWEDKKLVGPDGKPVFRFTTEILGNFAKLLGRPDTQAGPRDGDDMPPEEAYAAEIQRHEGKQSAEVPVATALAADDDTPF